MSLQQIFDFLAVKVDGPAAADISPLTFDWVLPDIDDSVQLELSNGTLHARPGSRNPEPHAVVTADRSILEHLIATGEAFTDLADSGAISVTGDVDRVVALFGGLQGFPLFWNVIEP